MKFKKLIDGKALFAERDRLWVARGMTFFAVDYSGRVLTRKYKISGALERFIGLSRPSRQLLRCEIHHLLPLENGDIFVTAKKKSFLLSPDGEVKNVFSGYIGNKPAHQGVCVTPDGTVFFGEYSVNLQNKSETSLFRSTDGCVNFEKVLTFKRDKVRHIHFVKYDPYESCLWLGTGDRDSECLLMRSDDNGTSWRIIGGGSQLWRAIGVCFTENALVWGTDAGSVRDKNRIVSMDRATHEPQIIADAEGPCHGCASFADGRIFISTGVEGGENETDRYARLKAVLNGRTEDIIKMKKDALPFILQYGVMRFPLGTDSEGKVVFTAMGLRHGGERVYIEQ